LLDIASVTVTSNADCAMMHHSVAC